MWVVWALLVGSVEAPDSEPINTGGGSRIGTTVHARFASTATVQPASIITDKDRPDLSGPKTSDPPGTTNVSGQQLSGGATLKWDMSRRIKIRATSQTPAFNPPVLLDKDDDFPSDPVVGNDDAGVGDENNNPYSNNGVLASSDDPLRGFTLQGGNVGDTYRSQLWFQEFARLEIEGNWQIISDSLLWRVDFKMKKEVVSETLWGIDFNGDGDMNDNVTETDFGSDANGDGDMNDELGFWNNNSSLSANDNAGS